MKAKIKIGERQYDGKFMILGSEDVGEYLWYFDAAIPIDIGLTLRGFSTHPEALADAKDHGVIVEGK